MDSEQQDSILGCLLGLASGDAVGMPTEFLTPTQIKAYYGRVENFLAPHAGHFHDGMPAGRVTDDTGQALALARMAVEVGGQLSSQAAARALVGWADSLGSEYKQVVGPSTSRALDMLRRGVSPEIAGREGKTNGAAMRAPIAGLLHAGDVNAALHTAYIVSLPTHGTSTAIAGAAAVACAISQALIPGVSLKSILSAAQEGAIHGAELGQQVWSIPLEKRIELALHLVDQAANEEAALLALTNYVGTDLLVAESVATAFGVTWLARGEPVQAIILSSNLGGDTDTIGAIAGAICGAWKGASAFPPAWLDLLEQVNGLGLEKLAKQIVQLSKHPEKGMDTIRGK